MLHWQNSPTPKKRGQVKMAAAGPAQGTNMGSIQALKTSSSVNGATTWFLNQRMSLKHNIQNHGSAWRQRQRSFHLLKRKSGFYTETKYFPKYLMKKRLLLCGFWDDGNTKQCVAKVTFCQRFQIEPRFEPNLKQLKKKKKKKHYATRLKREDKNK